MKSLFNGIINKRHFILVSFLLLCSWGVYSAFHLPIDAVPDITNVQVMINTPTLSLETDQIEKSVTRIIEMEMAGLENIEEIRSISKFGLSQVNLIFKDGTDLFRSRNLVAQRLQNLLAQMPEGVVPAMAPPTTGLGEVFMYILRPKNPKNEITTTDLIYLRTVQEQIVKPQLKRIKGVAEIDTNGGYPKEIHINLNPQKMSQAGIRMDQIREQLQTIGENFGGGYVENNKEQILIKSSLDIKNLEQIKNIPLKLNYQAQMIRLRDIANIEVGKPLRIGAATASGEEVVLGTALMTVGANSKQVAEELERAVKKIKLPENVQLDIVYSRSYLVQATLKTVIKNLAEGAFLVFVILILFLGKWSVAFLVATAIPISMLIAISLMNPLHISANLMSLGAIDFGLLVDGSVVFIENFLRHKKKSLQNTKELIVSAATEVAHPVILGVGIIILVYFPLLALEGTEGKLFHPMAITVILALCASLLVAIFLMPVFGFYLLNRLSLLAQKEPFLFSKISQWYRKSLTWTLARTQPLMLALLFLLLITVFCFLRIGSEFVPQLNEHDLVIGVIRNSKISLTESTSQQKEIEKIIMQFPEVENVFSRLGTPESATDPMGPNFADTFVILKKNNLKNKSAEEITTELVTKIKSIYPEVELSPTQPIEMRFNEMLEGSRADISVRFYGPDSQKLMSYVEKCIELLQNDPDLREIQVDELTAMRMSPVLNIELNSEKMIRNNISLPIANLSLKSLMAGEKVGSYQEDLWRYPIYMRLDDSFRSDLVNIKNLKVSTLDGGEIALGQIANIETVDKVTTIARSFGERYGAVSLFLKGTDVGGFVQKAQKIIAENLPMEEGYRTEWGGQFKNLERARLRLFFIIPITFLIIFLLILNHFKKLRETTLILSGIPFAVSGGLFILWLTETNLSVSAIVGFIALMGISVLNCMVLMEFMIEHIKSEHDIKSSIITSCEERLRPVIMTALVAAFGFLPMVFSTGVGAEVQRPLALVVVGGILTATFSTLYVLPSFYLRWYKKE